MARRVFEAVKTSGVTISSSRRENSLSVRRTRFRSSNLARKLRSSEARSVMSGRYSYFRLSSFPMNPSSIVSSRMIELVESEGTYVILGGRMAIFEAS